MLLTVLIFVFVLLLSFGVVMLVTRPTGGERAIEQRMAAIKAAEAEGSVLEPGTPEFFKRTKLSQIDWIDNLLQRSNISHKIRLLISQAGSKWSVGGVIVATLGCTLAGTALAFYWLDDLKVALPLGLVAGAIPYFVLRTQRSRRLRSFDKALPDAVDLITRSLRAGHAVSAAIEIVSLEAAEPVRSEFREVYTQQNFGLPHREALEQLAQRVPSADLRFVVTAMLVQKETGGNLVDILERTTVVLRERQRIAGEIRTYTAQGRMTGWILSLLPIGMFFLLNLASPGYSRVLIDDPLGRKLVYAGVLMLVIGGLIVRKIVNVKV